jgi:hypothetical protein
VPKYAIEAFLDEVRASPRWQRHADALQCEFEWLDYRADGSIHAIALLQRFERIVARTDQSLDERMAAGMKLAAEMKDKCPL